MDEDVKKEFENIGKVFQIQLANIFANTELLNQHADIINLLKKNSHKSILDLQQIIKAIQEDMDTIFDMLHDLKNLPNILSVLQDFDKLNKKDPNWIKDNDEKSTTD